MRRRKVAAIGIVVATLFTACSNHAEMIAPPPPTQPPPAVSLAIVPSSLNLRVGDAQFLVHQARDSASRLVSTVVEWTSDNPGVATVSTDGWVTAIAGGTATITAAAGTLRATAVVTVHLPVPTTIRPSTNSIVFAIGSTERLTAEVLDQDGRLMVTVVAWSSQDPSIASVSADGTVTGASVGTTLIVAAAGAARAEVTVRVEPADFRVQWARTATASSEYSPDMWASYQATGTPNVFTCADESSAWASAEPTGVDWLELTYDQPVLPAEIRIHEVWAPGSIVRVEVVDESGKAHQVYSATPKAFGGCLRTLVIPVTGVTEYVSRVRVFVDQRQIEDWNEIDAVRLSGFRRP